MISNPSDVELSERTGRPIRWNGLNWPYYKLLMMLTFQQQGLKKLVLGQESAGANPSTPLQIAATETRQLEIMQLIFASVTTDLGQRLMDFKTGTEMWKYLENFYEGKVNQHTIAMTKRMLFSQLQAARCKPGGDVAAHLNYMTRLKRRLDAVGGGLEDSIFIGMLMSSLPANEKFDRLRGMVEVGLDSLNTSEKVMDMILQLDYSNKMEKALSSSAGQVQHGAVQEKGQKKSASKGKEGVQAQRREDMKQRACFQYHKVGHRKAECPTLSSSDGSGKRSAGETKSKEVTCTVVHQDAKRQLMHNSVPDTKLCTTNVTGDSSTRPVSKDAVTPTHQVDAVLEGEYSSKRWLLDNAANAHIVGTKKYFVTYRKLKPGDTAVKGVKPDWATSFDGVGTVEIHLLVDTKLVRLRLERVFYLPNAGRNVVSQSCCEQQGFVVAYDSVNHVYTVTKNGMKAMVVEKKIRRVCSLLMRATHSCLESRGRSNCLQK